MDRRQEGLKNLKELVGEDYAALRVKERETETFGWPVSDLSTEGCFSDIWGRKDLDKRARCIATLGMLIALGGEPAPLKTYVRIALRNGLTVKEVEEIIIHAIPYVGYPRAGAAVRAAREALADDSLIPLK